MSESTPEDRQEQRATPTRDAPLPEVPDVPLEAPAPDVVEQAVATGPGQHVATRAATPDDCRWRPTPPTRPSRPSWSSSTRTSAARVCA